MRIRHLSLLLFLALIVGCGKSGPEVVPVSGVVTVDGQPLANVDVMFQPEGGKGPSYGRTDKQGLYELAYKQGIMGALVGSHKVRISVSHELVPNPPRIAAKFDTNTELKYEVKSGKNTDVNFDVTTEGK